MKLNLRRMVSLLLVLLLAVGILGGCGKTEEVTSETADTSTEKKSDEQAEVKEEAPTEKTKIVWWTHQRHDMDFMQAKVDAFMAENPDIEIEYVIQTDNYAQNLELAFQSGDSPDIFSMRATAAYYNDRGMIAPLDDYITDEHKERFGDLLYVEDNNYIDGSTYSLPNFGNIFRMVYSKDLMAKAGLTEVPTTLSEYVEFVGAITEAGKADGEYGFAINLKTPGGAFSRAIDKIAEASGLQPYDYTTGKYDFGRMKPIIEAFAGMYADGSMFPGVEALSMDPLRSQFADGKIGSYISAHWEVGVYNNQFPTEVDWAAAPVPVVDGTEGNGKIGASKAGIWQGIASDSEVKDEAFRVLDYFYSQDTLVEYHNAGLGFSIIPSVLADVSASEVHGANDYTFNESIDTFFPSAPASFGYCPSKDMKVEGKSYADVLSEVIIGVRDIDEAIEDLNKRYNEANDKAVQDGEYEAIVIENFDF